MQKSISISLRVRSAPESLWKYKTNFQKVPQQKMKKNEYNRALQKRMSFNTKTRPVLSWLQNWAYENYLLKQGIYKYIRKI